MANYYNLDGIKTHMASEIEKEKAFLAAWEAVTFPTKKDGKPFANMAKNISGAKYTVCAYAMQPGEYELTVYTSAKYSGYIHDSIKCYDLVKYMDDTRKAKTENYMEKLSYLEQVYKFDLDDIKSAIQKRIAYYKENIAAMEASLQNAGAAYKNFVAAYGEAVKKLEADAGKASDPTLFYAIFETVKERYPYC